MDIKHDDINNQLVQKLVPIIELYQDGLITDFELLGSILDIASQRQTPDLGVLDHNTGLRYE
jgi:hypothetical protein